MEKLDNKFVESWINKLKTYWFNKELDCIYFKSWEMSKENNI